MKSNTSISIIGCGFVGKLLAQQLLHKNNPVASYVNSGNSLAECNSKNIPCQLINLDSPHIDLDLTRQRVIYLVPPPGTGRTDTRMQHFLKAIAKHVPEKFVLISTTGVYGNCDGAWVDETWPLNPTADRAHRRADAEQQVQSFCQQQRIPLVILRVAGIYGPGKIPVERIKSGEPVVNQQDSPFTNRIHVTDLVNVCEVALLSQAITGIYNVTDGHPGTMYDYFTGIAARLNLSAPPAISLEQARQQLSTGMLSYMAESRRIDNAKLLKDFGMTLQFSDLERGLESL